MRAMTDFQREPPLTAAEDCDLDTALDNMFRLGVRAFLVVRELVVVGLITVEDIRQALGYAAAALDGADHAVDVVVAHAADREVDVILRRFVGLLREHGVFNRVAALCAQSASMATNSGSHQVSGVFPDLFLQNVFRPAMFACPQCGEIGKLEKE